MATGELTRLLFCLCHNAHLGSRLHDNDDTCLSALALRVLLRSVEGEGLAEYSIRAYSVYRNHGVILDEDTPRRRSILSGDFRRVDTTMSGPAAPTSGAKQNSTTVEVSDSQRRLTDDRCNVQQGSPQQDGCSPRDVGSEPVRPFSSPAPRATIRAYEERTAADSVSTTIDGKHTRETPPEKLTLEKDLTVHDLSEGGRTPPDAEDTLQSPQRPKSAFRSRIQPPRAGPAAAMAATTARRRNPPEKTQNSTSPEYRLQKQRASNRENARNTSSGLRQQSQRKNDDHERRPKSPEFRVNSSGTDMPPPPPLPTTDNGHEPCRDAEEDLHDNHHGRSRPQPVEAWPRNEPNSNDIGPTDDATVRACAIAARESSGRGKNSKGVGVSQGSAEGNRTTSSVAEVNKSTCSSLSSAEDSETSTLRENDHQRKLSVTLRVEMGCHCDPATDDEGIRPTRNDLRAVEQTRQASPGAKRVLHAVPRPADPPHLKSAQSPASNARGSRMEDHQGSEVESNRLCHGNGNIVAFSRTSAALNSNERGVNPQAESAADYLASAAPDIETNRSTQRISPATQQQRHADEGFVWLVQPDTFPAGQQSDAETRGERRRHVYPAVEKLDDAFPLSDTTATPLRKHRSKAELLLQMEVRRQRNIIDRAAQARAEEGRARRARVGATVLKIINVSRDGVGDDLVVAAATPSQAHQDSPPRNSKPNVLKCEPGKVACNGVGLLEQQGKKLNKSYQREPENTSHLVKKYVSGYRDYDSADQGAKSQQHVASGIQGVGGETVEPEVGASANTHKITEGPSSSRYDGAAIRDGVVQQVDTPTVQSLYQQSRHGCSQNLASAAEASPPKVLENPWRNIGRASGGELVPAVRAPTPPPISFDVTADELRGGRRGGGWGGDEDRARRRERFEGLRSRKLLEAEVRKVYAG